MPKGGNLRRGRYSEAGRLYHLTTVTHERRPHFAVLHRARIAIRAMRYSMRPVGRNPLRSW